MYLPVLRKTAIAAAAWLLLTTTFGLTTTSPARAATIGFGLSAVSGTTGANPTTLAWGPDGRLYVGYMFGTIRAYSIVRDGKNKYRVTGTETLNQVANIQNHNDNGQPNNSVTGRLLLGIAVTGTASNPVIYASSSDPRIGAGKDGTDTNLDTNSGSLSRLTKSGSGWNHTVLVQGLPRSEENHAGNGLHLSGNGKTLYWAYGGNTNKGGPSNNFAKLPEYAYSAAILKVDLEAIGNSTYNMPTLDDPSRGPASGSNKNDVNDPFGGNNGANQAKITSGSPVQIHAPGFRNAYDLVITTTGNRAGKMYVPDNGPNSGWGDTPDGEGTPNCTNKLVGQTQSGSNDALHLVSAGYYGGHPNPTRGNKNNTWNGQSPVLSSNSVECHYRGSKTNASTSISLLPNSSNGIVEYTANNFGGAMVGDLILAGYQGRKIVRISLNSNGTSVTLRDDNFATFNQPARPLDVTAMGPSQAFPGTIWIADISTNNINVMEPNDFSTGGGGGGGGGGGCTGAYSWDLDEDGDGYKNADEIDNGTNPCSAASTPPDNDGDGISDLNDPDDDNDGIPDVRDPFAIDPNNGRTTKLPVRITWENDAPRPGGIINTGFTGLMINGKTDYLNQFDADRMTVGGAAGVLTVGRVPEGDALKLRNSQRYGFQLGVNPPSSRFVVSTRIVSPFDGMKPRDHQSMGLFIGDGSQSNYLKVVVAARKGDGGVQMVRELQDRVRTSRMRPAKMPGPDHVDLFIIVRPQVSKARVAFRVTRNGTTADRVVIGKAVKIPQSWIDRKSLAIGIISTSRGPGTPFPATWDFIRAVKT